MTLLALWEAFQLLTFPDLLWLQLHKGFVSPFSLGSLLAEKPCTLCLPSFPGPRSVPVTLREEAECVSQVVLLVKNKVSNEVRIPACHWCWAELPTALLRGTPFLSWWGGGHCLATSESFLSARVGHLCCHCPAGKPVSPSLS